MPRDLGWSWTNIYGSSEAGLKTQECQQSLSAIYIGMNQNSINSIASIKVRPWLRVYPKIVNCTVPSQVDQWDSGANLRDQSA